MSVFGDNTHTRVFVSLVLIGTILSSIASVLMLIIIRRLDKWTGHILLVSTMTIFTLIYDVTFFSGVVDVGNLYVTVLSNCIQLFSGITSSLISNVVAWITFYVVTYRTSIDIFKNYYLFMLVVAIPATIDCCIFLGSLRGSDYKYLADIAILEYYYYLKLISIALNFFFVSATAYEIRRIGSRKHILSKHETALNSLSMRLFFYPIIQSISRSGCAWYEFQYRYDNHNSGGFDLNPPHTGNTQFAAQVVMALTMPLGSIGYLIIFLLMQPKAYEEFQKIFGCYKPKKMIRFDSANSLLQYEGNEYQADDMDIHLLPADESMFTEHDDEIRNGGESMDEEKSYTSESFLRYSLLEESEIDSAQGEYSSQPTQDGGAGGTGMNMSSSPPGPGDSLYLSSKS
jgi:hypothetical protein